MAVPEAVPGTRDYKFHAGPAISSVEPPIIQQSGQLLTRYGHAVISNLGGCQRAQTYAALRRIRRAEFMLSYRSIPRPERKVTL